MLTEQPKEKTVAEKSKTVTSSKTLDFPSLGWGIHAGEIRDLPADKDAADLILKNHYITVIK